VVVTVPADAAVNDNATLYVTVNGVASNSKPIHIVGHLRFMNQPGGATGLSPTAWLEPGYLSTPYCQPLTALCQPAVGSSLPYYQFLAVGGSPPYAFSAPSAGTGPAPYNTIPEGLTYSAQTLNGTPVATLSGTLVPLASGGYQFNATTTYAGTYNFMMTVTDSAGRTDTANMMLTVMPPPSLSSSAALQDCIGPNGANMGYGMICQLAPGTYQAPFPDSYGNAQSNFVIGRSGYMPSGSSSPVWLTVTGYSIGGPADTVLQRFSENIPTDTYTNVIMTAPLSGSVGYVAINNLTFDGNRYGFGINGAGISCWNNPQGLGYQAPPGYQGNQLAYIDLFLEYGGPFQVESVDFINAPGTALLLGGTGNANLASSVSYSNFGQGGTGIGPGGGAAQGLDGPQTATRFTAIYLEGSYTAALYNRISYAGSGITFDRDGNNVGTNQTAYGNTLTQNRYELPDGISGGQFAVYQFVTNAFVAANVMDGAGWPTADLWDNPDPITGLPTKQLATGCTMVSQTPLQVDGIEASGVGHGFFNNEITHYTGGGMAISDGDTVATKDVTISSNNPSDPNDAPRFIEYNASDGIVLFGPPHPAPADTAGVTLDAVFVQNNAGFGVSSYFVENDDPNKYIGFINGSCISGNGSVTSPWNGCGGVCISATGPVKLPPGGCLLNHLTPPANQIFASAPGRSQDVNWCYNPTNLDKTTNQPQPANPQPNSWTTYSPKSKGYQSTPCPSSPSPPQPVPALSPAPLWK
jgi:hypothetical protein